MSNAQLPSEQELKGFMQKLGQFRETLGENEQRMLDAMAIAAFSSPKEESEGDVQGYQWIPGPYGNWIWRPNYYYAPTPWAYAYNVVPVAPAVVWYP